MFIDYLHRHTFCVVTLLTQRVVRASCSFHFAAWPLSIQNVLYSESVDLFAYASLVYISVSENPVLCYVSIIFVAVL
jgi:hypothetical protein